MFERRTSKVDKVLIKIALDSVYGTSQLWLSVNFSLEEDVRPRIVTLKYQISVVAASGDILLRKMLVASKNLPSGEKFPLQPYYELPDIPVGDNFTIVVEIIKCGIN